MAEPTYGAFGDVLNLEEQENQGIDPIIYNVYRNQAQTYSDPQNQQYTYGTAANPVFEWVKRIQSGERTYNPQDNFDTDLMAEYQRMNQAGEVPDDFMTPDMIMKQIGRDTVSQVAGQVGGRVGAAVVDPYLASEPILDRAIAGAKTTFSGNLPYEEVSSNALNKADLKLLNKNELQFDSELANLESATAANRVADFENIQGRSLDLNQGLKDGTTKLAYKPASQTGAMGDFEGPISTGQVSGTTTASNANVVTGGTNASLPASDYFSNAGKSLNWSEPAGAANWSSAAGAAGFSFVANLAMGAKPKQALKSAAGTMIGRVIGQALIPIPGVGAFIGGTVGSVLAGRVICNELCKQGLIDRKMLLNDYRFTKDYLTPQYVNGYHVWAVWMVKQLRKKRFLSFWQHIVIHRGNEIAYIYSQKDKPDYLGKLYRKVFEPICWILGAFCKQTDWSVLYQKKEI